MNLRKIELAAAAFGIFILGGVAVPAISQEAITRLPSETADGRLDFKGMDDRRMMEFIATQLYVLNRGVSNLESIEMSSRRILLSTLSRTGADAKLTAANYEQYRKELDDMVKQGISEMEESRNAQTRRQMLMNNSRTLAE